MNSFAALSKACGPIFHRTHKDDDNLATYDELDYPDRRCWAWLASLPPRPPARRRIQATRSWPPCKQYCVGCHNDKAKIGGVSFQGITAASIAKDPELFEKAVRKLRGRVMPPPGARQPDGKAVDSLVAWLEDSLDKLPNQAHVTDQVVLHRLNRKEYENAVHDLLLVDVNGAELLPPDDTAQGFDNIASALQVSPSFVEQYVLAAHNVALTALGKRDTRPQGWTFRAASGNQLTHVPGLPLGTRGGILAKVDLPADGEYHINIADMATHIWGNGMEYENPLVVTVDNKIVYQTVIGGEEDMKLYDQVQSGAIDRVNARLKNIKFEATAGPHNIGVTFRRQSFAESDDQLQMFAPGGGQDRSYRVSSFQLLGPFDVNRPQLHAQPRSHLHLQSGKGQEQNARSLRQGDFLDAGEAGLSPSGNE